jgi:osmotically-inducible protein OsmY
MTVEGVGNLAVRYAGGSSGRQTKGDISRSIREVIAMRTRFRSIAIVLLFGLVAVLAARPGVAKERTPLQDDQIRGFITHQLGDKHIAGVHVSVAGGVVTLDGMVQSAWQKTEAIDIARKARDVHRVVSTLTIARAESDRAIADKIADQVRRYVFYTVFDDIGVSVENGVVTVTGAVTDPFKATEIANLASRVQGVQEVKNQVATLPVSPMDEQLRRSIASRIYRDPMFWNYAIQVNPPVHVIVENGKVTLTGVVNSEIERRQAEMIARTTFGVFAVNDQLRVERG